MLPFFQRKGDDVGGGSGSIGSSDVVGCTAMLCFLSAMRVQSKGIERQAICVEATFCNSAMRMLTRIINMSLMRTNTYVNIQEGRDDGIQTDKQTGR